MTPDPLPLPPLGGPATRGLDAAGFTDLRQLDGVRVATLLALHGVGSKAVRLLQEAMTTEGLALG